MKILVLEDDFLVLKGAFEYLNAKFYSGTLVIENYSKTQDFQVNNINDYAKIFVDISLHRFSDKDGYSFITGLKGVLTDFNKVVVITGSDKVTPKLVEMGLSNIKVLMKPITFLDLKEVMPTAVSN